MISTEAICVKCFGKKGNTSWTDSPLRKWLNKEFLNDVFDPSVQPYMIPVVPNDPIRPYLLGREFLRVAYRDYTKNNRVPELSCIFLLGEQELALLNEYDRIAYPLIHDEKLGIRQGEKVRWWLRPRERGGVDAYQEDILPDPDETDEMRQAKDTALCVSENGQVTPCDPDDNAVFVRPAFWLGYPFIHDLTNRAIDEWGWLLHDVQTHSHLDERYFRMAARHTFDLLCFNASILRNRRFLSEAAPKGILILQTLLTRYAEANGEKGNPMSDFAKRVAAGFREQFLSYTGLYNNEYDRLPVAALLMQDENGKTIAQDAVSFQPEKKMSLENWKRNGYYTKTDFQPYDPTSKPRYVEYLNY